MMGADNRNENRAAPSLVTPVSNPVVIGNARTRNSRNDRQSLR
jgi:hypothetical protein